MQISVIQYSAVNHSQHVFHYILRPYSSYKRILVLLMSFQPKPMEDPHHTSWEGSLPRITNVHVLCLQVLLIYGLHMFLTGFISALPVMVLGTYSAITWVLNIRCLSFLPTLQTPAMAAPLLKQRLCSSPFLFPFSLCSLPFPFLSFSRH